MSTIVKIIFAVIALLLLALVYPMTKQVYDQVTENGSWVTWSSGTTSNNALVYFQVFLWPVIFIVLIILYVVMTRRGGQGGQGGGQ